MMPDSAWKTRPATRVNTSCCRPTVPIQIPVAPPLLLLKPTLLIALPLMPEEEAHDSWPWLRDGGSEYGTLLLVRKWRSQENMSPIQIFCVAQIVETSVMQKQPCQRCVLFKGSNVNTSVRRTEYGTRPRRWFVRTNPTADSVAESSTFLLD
jgi:hypothetical protein